MKTIRLQDEDIDGASNVPLAPDFNLAAQQIIDETNADSQLPSIERAARLAGASLILGVAGGSVEGKLAYDFLRNLFEKKTPAPVQRIEQRTHADFRVVFQAAVKENPDILEMSLAKAQAAHAAIQEKLSLPPTLELTARVGSIADLSADESAHVADEAGEEEIASEFTRESPSSPAESPDWKPGQELQEISHIRSGGLAAPKATTPLQKEVKENQPLSDRHRHFIETINGGR